MSTVSITDYVNSPYSDLFGIGKGKAARQAKRAERRKNRDNRKIEKARVAGEKERAKLGLTDIPTAAASPATGSGSTFLYAGIGVAVLVIAVIIFIIKRK